MMDTMKVNEYYITHNNHNNNLYTEFVNTEESLYFELEHVKGD